MYQDLYEYLVLNKQLSIPGIGTFLLERKPAGTDITHRQITPPLFSIRLDTTSETPAKKLFYWLAAKLHIHYHEAIVRFNSFSYDLKQQVMAGNKITWQGVGTFSKAISGEIRFDSLVKDHRFDPPVSATRMIRDKAVHTVRVGEEERTSDEMTEWLNPDQEKKSYWWAPALIAVVILLLFIIIYFSQNGFTSAAAGNQKTLSPEHPAPAYTVPK